MATPHGNRISNAQLRRFNADVEVHELQHLEFDPVQPWPQRHDALHRSHHRPDTVQEIIHVEYWIDQGTHYADGWTQRLALDAMTPGTRVHEVAEGSSGPIVCHHRIVTSWIHDPNYWSRTELEAKSSAELITIALEYGIDTGGMDKQEMLDAILSVPDLDSVQGDDDLPDAYQVVARI
jgi:hypothetical protein